MDQPSRPGLKRFRELRAEARERARARRALEGRRSRGIYILPNAFTTAALFCGFYAIVQSMNQRFEAAAIAIFIAMVLDGLDGRVARMTNTQSAFGEQFDSLSDMVSFGVAPALVMYEWTLRGLGKWGWLAAFVYCAGAALRLARFNANIGVVDKRYFQGLPSPAAAAMIAGMIWIVTDLRETKWITSQPTDLAWVAWVLTVYAGLTMVSNAPFWSGKDINLKRSVPFIGLLAMVLFMVVVSSDPPVVLFSLFIVYGLSGYVVWFWRWWSGRGLPWREAADHSAAAGASTEVPTGGSTGSSAGGSAGGSTGASEGASPGTGEHGKREGDAPR